tara:strand:- start:681 stop:866 length:186 start_codon:yes stop_codon:yes gene_type:complete
MGVISMTKLDMIRKIDSYTATKLPTITKFRMMFYDKKRLGKIYYYVKNYYFDHNKRKIIAK